MYIYCFLVDIVYIFLIALSKLYPHEYDCYLIQIHNHCETSHKDVDHLYNFRRVVCVKMLRGILFITTFVSCKRYYSIIDTVNMLFWTVCVKNDTG